MGIDAGGLCSSDARAVLGETGLELAWCLNLDLLLRRLAVAGYRVAGGDATVLLGLVEVLHDAVAVLVEDLVRDTLHAEDLDIKALAVGQRILDLVEGFFMDLVQVHGETSGSVETTTTSVALEVLGLLMRDKELQILKVTLAVVAPWPRQDVLDIGVTALLLAHCDR